MKHFYFISMTLTLGVLQACVHGMQSASSRPMAIEKAGSLPASQKPPELFIRNKTVDVKPVEKINETGSLFNMEDQRNYLFLNKAPLSVGQYLTVQVAASKAAEEQKAAADKKGKVDDAAVSDDATLKELLAALPNLDPGDNSIKLQTKLKMKVDHIFENGDALVTLKRSSENDAQNNEIDVSARIPAANLVSSEHLTTNDLYDVHWFENDGAQVANRYSSAWEDEYSLRLSGFNEAKSKYAQELDEKRKQMEATRERMRNQLISMGKERKTMASERDKLSKQKAESEQRADDLEKKVQEQEGVIESQKDEIADLKPKEDSGDNANGDGTKLASNGSAKGAAPKGAAPKAAAAPKATPVPATKPNASKPGDKKDGAKGK